jgi:hypothetical protein
VRHVYRTIEIELVTISTATQCSCVACSWNTCESDRSDRVQDFAIIASFVACATADKENVKEISLRTQRWSAWRKRKLWCSLSAISELTDTRKRQKRKHRLSALCPPRKKKWMVRVFIENRMLINSEKTAFRYRWMITKKKDSNIWSRLHISETNILFIASGFIHCVSW